MNTLAPLARLFPPTTHTPPIPLFHAAPAPEDTEPKKNRRSKLWELAEKHHCPIMGSCLSVQELTKFSQRHFPGTDCRDEYAMHVKAVKFAASRNAASEAIQKHLERKYQLHIRVFDLAQTDTEVLNAWREHYARGDVAGALWAATTHKAIGPESEQQIFSDIHMLSHQVGAGQAADARRLSFLEKELQTAKSDFEAQRQRYARQEAELRQQLRLADEERNQLRPLKNEVVELKTRLSSLESGTEVTELERKLRELQTAHDEQRVGIQRAWALEKSLRAAHDEAQTLAKERDQLIAERDALQRLLGADEVENKDALSCAGSCDNCSLSTTHGCVLYVGGRASLLSQYRALADRLGIRLIHHDGGIEESLSRLPDLINGADAVLCPTDCVSHSAYYQLKRQCKRSGKPCLLFKGSGISGFAVALARLAAGQSSLSASHCD